jgi:hypothetical protein
LEALDHVFVTDRVGVDLDEIAAGLVDRVDALPESGGIGDVANDDGDTPGFCSVW